MQPPPGKPRVPPPPPPGSGFPPPPRNVPSQPGPGRVPAYGSAPMAAPAGTAATAPWNAAPVSPALAMQAMAMPLRPRPNRGFLRFFAISCISTAWLTLVLFLIFGLMSFASGGAIKAFTGAMPSYSSGSGGATPGSDSDSGLGGLGGGGVGGGGLPSGAASGGGSGPMLQALLAPMIDRFAWLFYLGGVLNILSGIFGYIFFVGLGKLTYGFLDLDEQAERDHEAVQILLASAGSR
jgi:hypothetical protein